MRVSAARLAQGESRRRRATRFRQRVVGEAGLVGAARFRHSSRRLRRARTFQRESILHVEQRHRRPRSGRAGPFRQAAARRLRAVVLASRHRRGLLGVVSRGDRGARHRAVAGRPVRGAGRVRNSAARADPGQDPPLHRDRRRRPGGRQRYARLCRRHRDQGADGRAVAHRGAGVFRGVDAGRHSPRPKSSSPSSAITSPTRAATSRAPAPRRCSASSACAGKSRRGSCRSLLTELATHSTSS